MHTTMVPEHVKTQKIQAGVKVSRLEDKDVIFSIGSSLEDFILLYSVLFRNIYSVSHADADVDNFKRCCTSYTLNVGYRVLRDLLLQRSSIKNSASLSIKFGRFVGIKRLLDDLRVTAAQWDQQVVSELVALRNFAKKTWIKTQYIWWLHQKCLCSNQVSMSFGGSRWNSTSRWLIILYGKSKRMAHRRLELKARSTLLMGIPNEHQLKFNSIKDAKSLLQAIEKSSEVLDQTFDRLQKLISQLEIHSESILQEDVNKKFLRSLSPEWNTHTIVWRNKPKIDTLSLDDLYNNLKIYEPESIKQSTTCNEDLQQINPDDLEEMDLRAPRNQKNSNRENTRRVVPVETTDSNALISCDGLGDYDWTDQVEEGPTNFALMAYSFTSSNYEVSIDSNCSSSCLESVEARLLVYKKNKSVYAKDIKLLKCEIYLKEVAITELRRKLELAQKQKDEIQLTVENFENSSKNLSKLLDCQIVDKCKTGLGYNVVPPSYTGNFIPPKPDLSFSGLEEFINEPIVSEPTIKKPVSDSEGEDMPQAKVEKKIVKPSFAKIKFVNSNEQVKSPRKTTVKQGDQNRLNTYSPKGNQRNWNNMMSQRLRSNFEMFNKACYVCGSFEHLQYNCDNHQRHFNNKKMVKPVWSYTQRVNHQNFSRMTHLTPKRNKVPKAALMTSGLVSLTTARPVNTAQPKSTVNSARPMTNVFNKAHSTVRRPINNKIATKNNNFNQGFNIVKDKNVNTVRPKAVVNTAKPKSVLNAVKGNQVNDVKASACWVWKPKTKGTCPILLTLKKLIEDMLPLELTPKEGKSQAELTDESHVLIKVPRKNNMYSVDLKNIIPKGGLTCLFAKATSDESKLWHRRLGHINFKTMNKLVKRNLVRGIKREFSVARTPQQNGVAERKNRNLIEVARTMLVDSKLPTTFWAEAVNTACYVQNRGLVIKPHNKTPYEFFLGRKPSLGFMRTFGCHVTILNTIDHLGKFDGKADEGFFVGYSINSKAFRVFNSRTRIVKENLYNNP
ncbi:ribonuclease H-like domain-containing protein [Tanacetum coccineum]